MYFNTPLISNFIYSPLASVTFIGTGLYNSPSDVLTVPRTLFDLVPWATAARSGHTRCQGGDACNTRQLGHLSLPSASSPTDSFSPHSAQRKIISNRRLESRQQERLSKVKTERKKLATGAFVQSQNKKRNKQQQLLS